MSGYSCPACQQIMLETVEGLHCEHCDGNFRLQAICPDCHQPLEVLKACGAVDYFCPRGHGLISKRCVVFTLVASQAGRR